MTWSNTVAGTSLSASVIDDDVINYAFDTIALRPASAGLSAASIVFREVKVERILPAAKTSS
jgi:hypothetical protein